MSVGLKKMAAVLRLLGVAALVAGCGGSGTLVSNFSPARFLAFGDETTALTADGRNYGINALNTAGTAVDCTKYPNWVEYVAQNYGLPFPQCNPGSGSARSLNRAFAGAKVADLATQIDTHLLTDGFNPNDVALILMGQNDVLEQYALYPAQGEDVITAELEKRGTALAADINRISQAGAKVVIVSLPDLGVTPFALTERLANPGVDRAALLSRLTDRFNAKLLINLPADGGRQIALINGQQLLQAVTQFPGSYGYTDVVTPACAAASLPPNCTTATLVTGASATTWLWASDRLLSASGQRQIGASVDTRVRNAPF